MFVPLAPPQFCSQLTLMLMVTIQSRLESFLIKETSLNTHREVECEGWGGKVSPCTKKEVVLYQLGVVDKRITLSLRLPWVTW